MTSSPRRRAGAGPPGDEPERLLTARDRGRTATAGGLDRLLDALGPLAGARVESMLDVGCGFGGVTLVAAERLGAARACGVDIDAGALEEAVARGVEGVACDIGAEALPYDDCSFEFVMSLGMLDYLPAFDHAILEIRRVLAPGGHALISLPNLGSWHNRLGLLLGYQPRDVEVSERKVVGVLPHYRGDAPTGHLHTPTLRAFDELMGHHGFDRVRVSGGAWRTRDVPVVVGLLDRALAKRPSLARRFFYLARRPPA